MAIPHGAIAFAFLDIDKDYCSGAPLAGVPT
jgi:hypothetical protein